MSSKQAIVIGGGIAGASIARVLSRRGMGVTLLEKSSQLCSGATWHAAGLVTRFGGSPKLKKIHVDSLRQLTALHEEHDVGLHLTGSIRIVEKGNTDRYKEARQHCSMASLYDDPEFPTRMISPEEIKELHPLIDLQTVDCGLYTPCDGDIDPTTLTNCVARLAKEHGATFKLNREVVDIEKTSDGDFVVRTSDGYEERGDILINAAGLWSKQISEMIDPSLSSHHKCYIIEHQYAITEELPELKKLSEQGTRVPVLRDLAGSSYIRQERTGMLVGPYESDCAVRNYDDGRGKWVTGPPSDWGHELFPDRLDRIEENLMAAMELIPSLGEVGITSCVNGPTIWTGDSLARVGRTHVENVFEMNTLTYGIAQSLPLADYLGGMILDGEPPFDATTDFDPLRYGSWCGTSFTEEKIKETYSHNNCVSYPFENRKAGREHVTAVATSSKKNMEDGTVIHPMLSELNIAGAHNTFSNSGLEVPAFYFQGKDDVLRKELNESKMDTHDWIDRVREEANFVLSGAAISYASFSKFQVRGTDAHALLSGATTAAIPKKVGRTKLTYVMFCVCVCVSLTYYELTFYLFITNSLTHSLTHTQIRMHAIR
jgi:dimethylglycine dehydrogenase